MEPQACQEQHPPKSLKQPGKNLLVHLLHPLQQKQRAPNSGIILSKLGSLALEKPKYQIGQLRPQRECRVLSKRIINSFEYFQHRIITAPFCVSHCVTETASYQEHTQGTIEVVHNNVADISIILLSGFLTLRHCHQ